MDDNQELASTSEENNDASVSSYDFDYDTDDSSQASISITPEPEIIMNNDEIEEVQGNQPERFTVIIQEVLVKLEDILAVFSSTRFTDSPVPTPPNANRNGRPDDEQSSHTTTRVKPARQEQPLALIPNPQEHFGLQVNRNAIANRNESVQQVRRMQDGRIGECMIQGGEYRNHNNFGNMLYDLNNQQPRYYSPSSLDIYGRNPNSYILYRPELFITHAIRPCQIGWIYLTNQNSQEHWNGQIHRNNAFTPLIPTNQPPMYGHNQNLQGNQPPMYGHNQNLQGNQPPVYGHNQNLQGNRPPMYGHNQNLQGNRPPMYGHNQNLQGNQPPMYGHSQNFNIPHQGTNYSQGTWNTHVRENIPTSQNSQHGWISQRPHNDRMPQSGNSNNFPRFGGIPGSVHQNHMNFGNMHYNLNIQHGYHPLAYGQNQNMNYPQAQEMYDSNGVGPTYVRNFTIHQNDEGGYGPSVSHNDMGAFGIQNDNGCQRGGRNPRREN